MAKNSDLWKLGLGAGGMALLAYLEQRRAHRNKEAAISAGLIGAIRGALNAHTPRSPTEAALFRQAAAIAGDASEHVAALIDRNVRITESKQVERVLTPGRIKDAEFTLIEDDDNEEPI